MKSHSRLNAKFFILMGINKYWSANFKIKLKIVFHNIPLYSVNPFAKPFAVSSWTKFTNYSSVQSTNTTKFFIHKN